MFADIIASLLRGLGADSLTELFVWVMLLCFVAAVVFHKLGRAASFTRFSPTLLTSLGILGTFTGVVTGLLDFDPGVDQIDKSIALLLEGLKTAFISSLVGMALSILNRLVVSIPAMQPTMRPVADGDATVENLVALHRRQTANTAALLDVVTGGSEKPLFERILDMHRQLDERKKDRHAAQLEMLHQIKKEIGNLTEQTGRQNTLIESVVGSSGKSFFEQLKDVQDAQDGRLQVRHSELVENLKLVKEEVFLQNKYSSKQAEMLSDVVRVFDAEHGFNFSKEFEVLHKNLGEQAARQDSRLLEVTELLRKGATDEIVAALERAVHEFNERLVEHLGDNFKHLNIAVERLVEWQENYRGQLADMRERFEESVRSLSETESAVAAIANNTIKIPQHMEMVSDVMEHNQHQISELDRHLIAFAETRDRAVNAVPEVQALISKTVEGFSIAGKELVSGVVKSTESMTKSMESSVRAYDVATQGMTRDAASIAERSHREIQASLDSLSGSLKKAFSDAQASLNTLIEKEFEDLTEARRNAALDEMSTMSTALVRITDRFTQDYKGLVSSMQSVVNEQVVRRG